MKLVIHMGLHKTATTSFQNFLHLNRNALLDAGVIYPEIQQQASHWLIPRKILQNNWSFLEDYMKHHLSTARRSNVKTVLLSSEDFETILLESFRAAQFEKLALGLGYSEIHWICVLRSQWDYFNSLYAEMSQQNVCLNYWEVGDEIVNFGELSIGNGGNRWRFAFDYDSIIESFLEDIHGSFSVISFDSFVWGDIVGKNLINEVFDHGKTKTAFWKSNLDFVEKKNIRRDDQDVEIQYLANYLGIKPTKDNFVSNENIFTPLVKRRLEYIDLVKEDLCNSFKERFPQISKRLS